MSDLRIVLVGKIGAGKTSAGNTILGRKEFRSEGAICVKRQGEVAGRQVTVVDTPGWDRVNTQRTPEQVKQEIVRSASLCPPGPHAFLLVIPVGEQLKQRFRKKEEEWIRRENEPKQGMRRRRHSIETPIEMSGDRGEEKEEQREENRTEPERQKIDLEAVRQGYREEAMALLKQYIAPAIVVVIAIIGGIVGEIAGAHWGAIGAAVGLPIGVIIALMILALVRGEVIAVRGNAASVSVTEPYGPSHGDPPLLKASTSTTQGKGEEGSF